MASYAVLLSLLSLLVAIAPVPALAQTEVRTQLGWLRNGEFAPVMVAEPRFFTGRASVTHHGRRTGQESRAHRRGGAGDVRDHGRRQQRLPAQGCGPVTSSPSDTLPAGPLQLSPCRPRHPDRSQGPRGQDGHSPTRDLSKAFAKKHGIDL